MNCKKLTLCGFIFCAFFVCCFHFYKQKGGKHIYSTKNIIYTGLRSSSYGARPFPEPAAWQNGIQGMHDFFPDATPCALWIVGVLNRGGQSCRLEFPTDGIEHQNIIFQDEDKHERFLDYFDEANIKVYLQVEPANASISELIDLVLSRYKHHQAVIGFGIDIEWFREHEYSGTGMPVTDDSAKVWETKVKSYNNSYRLFLKHWDRKWMPENYRGDIIFVSDSQQLKDLNAMINEFTDYWADYFKPNTVFYQIGYRSDKSWWEKLDNPPKTIGSILADRIKQKCGIFWVDFTMRDVLPIDQPQNISL